MMTTSKPSLDLIFKDAFGYWKQTLLYQLLFSLLFFSVLFSVVSYAAQEFGILEQYMTIFNKNKGNIAHLQTDMQELVQTPGYMNLSWVIMATTVFLFPLNIGFFKIFRKIDLKEKVTIPDLFSGYSGINFFIYLSFYLLWSIIYTYTMPTIVLGILWVLLTLFTVPQMFFENKRIFETIGVNFKVLKQHFLVIFVSVIAAVFIKYSGALLFGIGLLFTYPFFNAMIYSLYKHLFSTNSISVEKETL
jgi:hypothetical protein